MNPNYNKSNLLGAQESKVPRASTQVEAQARNCTNAIDNLDRAIQAITEKLEPVLRGEQISGDKAECLPPEEALVPVAERIRMFSKRVTILTQRIESLIERTEA